MRYYIIQSLEHKARSGSFSIVKVHLVDEANFIEDYGSRVIAVGNTLMEALEALAIIVAGK